MREKTFTKKTILSSFKNTGLFPFNPDIILKKIEAEKAQERPKTPPQEVEQIFASTPHTTKEIIQHGQRLNNTLHTQNFYDLDPINIERFVKGALANAHNSQLTERELAKIHDTATTKAARRRLTGKVVQKGGVVVIEDVRYQKAKRDEDEIAKARRVLERAEAKAKAWQDRVDKTTTRLFKAYGKSTKKVLQTRDNLRKERRRVGCAIVKYIELYRSGVIELSGTKDGRP